MKTALILGSNSDVGIASAHRFAKEGFDIYLATRNVNQSQKNLANDLAIRYQISCETFQFDALHTEVHPQFVENLPSIPDVVISVFGVLGDQEQASRNFREAARVVNTNFLGNVSILGLFAEKFEAIGSGSIICISSVAGERGRKSNYIYGSSKAALTCYLSGLRAELSSFGVHVATVIPGFIKTKMIGDMQTPGPLTAIPEEVGEAVYKAFSKKKSVIYVRGIWWLIMLIIKLIPENIFKKLNF